MNVLEQYIGKLQIVLAVDLVCEETRVRAAFDKSPLLPLAFLFLPDRFRTNVSLSELRMTFSTTPQVATADAVIICTEPKSHKTYALWALEIGLPVFMDKPITAFAAYDDAGAIQHDFAQILEASRTSGCRVVISCERRMHYGYKYVEDFLRSFIGRVRIPITYVNVHFGGGVWVMPWEFERLENHPLKYGYGVLLHSGYHYIDLIARLAEMNCTIKNISLDRPKVKVIASFPNDIVDAIGEEIYRTLFADPKIHRQMNFIDRQGMDKYGEVDISAIGSYKAEGKKCLDFSLQLLSTTVSARIDPARASENMPTNGRMRQEEVLIHLGNFCSIAVHSSPFRGIDGSRRLDDFNVTIAINPLISSAQHMYHVDRRALSRIYQELPDDAVMNMLASRDLLQSFLDDNDAPSDIASHVHSVALLAELFCETRRTYSLADEENG